ncbi:MAG TPA: hypothetical protein VFP91_04850 [Vicinamibacterales bacterium]|nr:hypothetical protein [Vicinamibacterales bacterium]
MPAPMHPKLLFAAVDSLGQPNDIFRGNEPNGRVDLIGHKSSTSEEAAVDQLISLLKQLLRVHKSGLKICEIAGFKVAHEFLRKSKFATNVPLAFGLVKTPWPEKNVEKLIDFSFCIRCVESNKPQRSN